MDRAELYDKMAERKSAPKDFHTYIGDNGRVNRCVQLMRQGKIKTGGRLVDVGGGIGDLGYAVRAENLFERTVNVDISEKNLVAASSKGNETRLGDVDRSGINYWDEHADVVTALDFIEHIVDPENFARECFRVLKPGGEVFINTPNIQFWRHIMSIVAGKFPHTSGDREVYHGGHLAFFTFDDLHEIFQGAGFKDCVQFHDEEGYQSWPNTFTQIMPPIKNQAEYVQACLRFGSPNLLFKATKP